MALSIDHKPKDEYARIEAAGSKVIQWNKHLVLGVLSMSRSIDLTHYVKYTAIGLQANIILKALPALKSLNLKLSTDIVKVDYMFDSIIGKSKRLYQAQQFDTNLSIKLLSPVHLHEKLPNNREEETSSSGLHSALTEVHQRTHSGSGV